MHQLRSSSSPASDWRWRGAGALGVRAVAIFAASLALSSGAGCADDEPACGDPDPCVVYLNFEGGPLWRGADDASANLSELVSNGANIAAFAHDAFDELLQRPRAEVIDDVVGQVGDHFAGFQVEVVGVRPDQDHYTMLLVGGNMSQLGESQSRGLWGFAPIDCGNTSATNVGFLFTEEFAADLADPIRDIAALAAHEIAHTFGLEHIENSASLMKPSLPNVACGWSSGDLSSETPRCRPSAETQDDIALLLENVGRDPSAPEPEPCSQ